MKQNIVSIFSGIDLLGLGFASNFNIVLHVEKVKEACDTLCENKHYFGDNTVWHRDIYTVSDEEILAVKDKSVIGLIGGPNCQPFSPARGCFNPFDERIKGLTEYLRWVRLLQPQFFVFENTYGLLEGSKKEIFKYFQKEAEHLGYNLSSNILDAHNYGSVQRRKRLICIGIRNSLNCHFELPQETTHKKVLGDILVTNEKLGECLHYPEERRKIVSCVPEGGNWRNLSDELQRKALGANYYKREGGMTGVYRRLSRTKPCPTLTTSPCQRNTMCCHPTEDRPLSIAEYSRAFGIPADYKLLGGTRWKYEAIGNGVPVEFATSLCSAIVVSMTYPILSKVL